MAQGTSIAVNAVAGKQLLPEINFVEETYKAVGGGIGWCVDKATGSNKYQQMGKNIASGVFTVVDIGLGFVSPAGVVSAASKISKIGKIEKFADVVKIGTKVATKSGEALVQKGAKIANQVESTVKFGAKVANKVVDMTRAVVKNGIVETAIKTAAAAVAFGTKAGNVFTKAANNVNNIVKTTTSILQKGTETVKQVATNIKQGISNTMDQMASVFGKQPMLAMAGGPALKPTLFSPIQSAGSVIGKTEVQKNYLKVIEASEKAKALDAEKLPKGTGKTDDILEDRTHLVKVMCWVRTRCCLQVG